MTLPYSGGKEIWKGKKCPFCRFLPVVWVKIFAV